MSNIHLIAGIPASGGGAPTGPAGGDLGGTYPNPTVASLTGSAGTITVNGSSTPINWSSGGVTLQKNGNTVISLGAASGDYIAFGASPPTAGQIRFSYPFNVYSTAQAGGASTVVTWMRAVADDSVQLGGPGASGLNFTSYHPNTNSDRNITLQLYCDNTQPTKDYIGFGGPDPNNVNGTNPFAGGGFLRIPTGGYTVVGQRNATNNGDYIVLGTAAGTTLGDLSGPGNTFINGQNNIYLQNSGTINVLFSDNSNNALQINGSSTGQMSLNYFSGVTAVNTTIGARSSTSSASGANGAAINITAQTGQAATGASHNGGAGGNLNLSSGAGGTSGSATAGAAGNVIVNTGATKTAEFDNDGTFKTYRTSNSAQYSQIGPGGPNSNYSSLWLGDITNQLGTPGSTNFALACFASSLLVNAPSGNIQFSIAGGNPVQQINGGNINFNAGETHNVITKSSTYTVDTNGTFNDYLVLLTGNAFTITLPAPTAGRVLKFKDAAGNAASQNKTIAQHASETIDGATSYVINVNKAMVTLVSDGTNWFVIDSYAGNIL